MSGSSRLALAVACALVGVLAVVWVVRGVYSGSWWLANDAAKRSYALQTKNNDRQAHMIQHSYQVQSGVQAEITADSAEAVNDIAGMTGAPNAAALHTNAINAGDQACAAALKLIPSALPVPREMQGWINANCSAGTLKLSSPIRTGSGN